MGKTTRIGLAATLAAWAITASAQSLWGDRGPASRDDATLGARLDAEFERLEAELEKLSGAFSGANVGADRRPQGHLENQIGAVMNMDKEDASEGIDRVNTMTDGAIDSLKAIQEAAGEANDWSEDYE